MIVVLFYISFVIPFKLSEKRLGSNKTNLRRYKNDYRKSIRSCWRKNL